MVCIFGCVPGPLLSFRQALLASHLSAAKTSSTFSFSRVYMTLRDGVIISARLTTSVPQTKEKGEKPVVDFGDFL